MEYEFADRYAGWESDGCFSRVKPSEAPRALDELARDLVRLVEWLTSHDEVRSLPEYKLLGRVLDEQCRITGSGADTKVEVKLSKAIAPDNLQNPSDPGAGYNSRKGQGYRIQIMETYQTETRDKK